MTLTAFQIYLNTINAITGFLVFSLFLIISFNMAFFTNEVFEFFYLFIFLQIITFKSDMSAQKIVNNLIMKICFSKRCVIFGDKLTFHTKSFGMSVSISTHYTCSCVKWVCNISQYKKTIQFAICKISGIGCVAPLWSVLVSWYPHSALTVNN